MVCLLRIYFHTFHDRTKQPLVDGGCRLAAFVHALNNVAISYQKYENFVLLKARGSLERSWLSKTSPCNGSNFPLDYSGSTVLTRERLISEQWARRRRSSGR